MLGSLVLVATLAYADPNDGRAAQPIDGRTVAGHLDGTGWPWGQPPGPGLDCVRNDALPLYAQCQLQVPHDIDGLRCELVFRFWDAALYEVYCRHDESTVIRKAIRRYETPPPKKGRPSPEVAIGWMPAGWTPPEDDAVAYWLNLSLRPKPEDYPEFMRKHMAPEGGGE